MLNFSMRSRRQVAFFFLLYTILPASVFAQTLRFQDVTTVARAATPNDPNGFGHGVAAGDFNNDGLPDIYVVNYTAYNALFLNNGNGTFNDAAFSANVAQSTALQDRGVAAADYDNDGNVDIYIATAANANKILYRNNGNGTFSDVTFNAGLSDYGLQGQGVAWGDYDNDGRLDLFLCSYDNAFKLYRQNSDHTFSEVTYSAGLDGSQQSVQAVFFDFDGDNDLDLFVGRGAGLPNRLFVNRGNGTFAEESASRNIADPAPHAQGITVGDYDNDGDLDLYMCSDQSVNRLYRNDGGNFTEVAAQAGVADNSRSLGCHFADFNNDGWLDLYVINFGTNRLYRNNGNGTFTDQTSGSGADNADRGYGSVVTDYDGDGLLDIYFSNSGQNSNLLRNTTASSNNRLKFALRGVNSNRNGIGARVLVTSGGLQQTQQLLSGFAMVSGGSDLTLHFGLGSNSVAERVEVIWPSGQRDVLTNVAANQSLTIQEGSQGNPPPNDTAPPVISNATATNITGSAATITWSTNEAADSQVEYGLTTSYGSATARDASLVISHSVIITGLNANTTYHYRIHSRDTAGNLATSGDFIFTTTAQTVVLTDNFSGASLDLNKWTRGGNGGNQSTVANGVLNLQSSGTETGWIFTKAAYPGANKIAQIKVVQPNDDGDLGMSPTVNANSANAFYDQNNWYRFYVYRNNHAGNYLLYAQWSRNGAVNGLDVTNGLNLSNNFWLRLRTDASNIYFEYSTNNANWVTAYQEAFNLPGYTLASSFYYELAASRTAINGALQADDFSLSESAPITDTQAPLISNVASSALTSSSALISWNTDEASDSQVEYGLTTGYGSSTPIAASLVMSHSVTLSGLSANTTYHFRVKSRDAAGNLATSNNFTFTTPASSGTVTIFADNFNGGTLNANAWQRGANSGNQTAVANNALELRSNGTQSGWVITKQSYAARNTTVAVKIVQPNDDGNLGMSPTYQAGSANGVYSEAAWYRFYAYRDAPGNYRLYVLWRKNGVEDGLDVTGNFLITAQSGVHLRMRFDDTHVHFEASLDGVNWTNTYNEPFALPGYTLDSNFFYELAASRTPTKGVMIIDDFAITAPGAPTDVQPPVISNVTAVPATNAATISWNTDEASDAQVEYGATTAYGSLSPLNGALLTAHSVALSGLTANTVYHYRVRSKDAAGNLAMSNDFMFQTPADGGNNITRTILNDALNGATQAARTGGQFATGGGWQVTTPSDMLVYDLGTYVENGVLEIDLQNFRPAVQNSYARHHFLSMFRNPWGNHHPQENPETVWDLHAGTNYAPGVKLLSWTYNENEEHNTVTSADFDPSQTYRIRMVWSGNQLQYFLNGVLQATHTHSSAMQVRYLFLGRDFTVSQDFVTDYNYNQYPALVGPIYANLQVTETLATNDIVPSQISNLAVSDLYANAARLSWNTNEAATCHVEYGLTSAYGQRTPVLGPPAQTHSTAIANLNPNQTYHYRIVAQDGAGNVTTSGGGVFITQANGVYLFKPVADTYVEQAGIAGSTRDHANFGWMNLMLSAGREAYLRFQIAGVNDAVTQTRLRLHGRQTGSPNATVRVLNSAWNESTVTWLTKPAQFGDTLGTIDSITAGQWREITLAPFVTANGTYDFALLNTGANAASLDARESTNFQPELIVTTLDTIALVISNVLASPVDWNTAMITWNTNEASDSQVEYGLTASYGSTTTLDATLVIDHSVIVTGLNANTKYHYRVRARDAAGNLALSNDFTFTTLPEPAAPIIANVNTANVTATSAQISFTTDHEAYGVVEFDTLAHDSTRVMPLGDSITEGTGSSDDAGYRSGMYALLTDFGSRFDFVGSMQYGLNIPDPDHEGHAGYRADEILPELNGYLQQSQPEAVLLHIGTNDVSIGDHYGTVVNEITAIVDAILQFNPATKIYLSTLLPRLDNKQSVNDAVNANLPDVVNERANAGYKIFLVDNSAAFLANPNWAAQWMDDNVHPNDAGYEVMAQQWHQAYINTEYENAVSSSTLATAHNIMLTNLTPSSTYHYRARAKDQAGLESASADFTFTTPSAPPATVALYGIHEITLRAQQLAPNPYTQGPSVTLTFRGISGEALGKTITLPGFWAGNSDYRVRFTPTHTGDWSWQSSSSDAGLNNQTGALTCAGALSAPHISARGHVRESAASPYTFAHADSTPFFLMGDTQWSFATDAITWPEEFQAYVDARAAQGFNYIHGLIYNVYPIGNEGNEGGPIFYGGSVDSLNPAFFHALDQRVAYMNAKGLVAGLMLAWGNGGWQNFSDATQVERFVKYVVARYAAYNVFWITAGEYEEAAPPGGHAYVGTLVMNLDPYRHPITTHTIHSSADDFANEPWQTTIYQQVNDPALITRDRIYGKPVINSEFGYEGDQSAEALRQDAWQIVMRGGFAVYGDTNTFHYHAQMTPQNLNSPGARFMSVLKNFWSNNALHQPQWWRFTRFDTLGAKRFLAGLPGFEYVVYADTTGAFTVDLSEASGTINGQWFDTRGGNWGATFSGNTSATFALTPPDSGYAAYLSFSPTVPPPVIAQVQTSNITSTSALVTWQTDKPADAQAEYGLNASYGALSVLDTAQVLNHEIALAGLIPNTLYHFRVRSRDAKGVLAVSDDFTFTTAPSPALFSDNFDGATLDLNKWVRGTNSGNQTTVANNRLELRSNGTQSGWVITRQSYAARNTTVAVRIIQPNDDGALGMAPVYNVASADGIYSAANWYRFYVYRDEPGDYRLFVLWKKNGATDGLDVTGNLIITAQTGVYLRLRFDDTHIHFEASLDNANWIDAYNEPFALPGYSLDSGFFYELAASRTPSRGVLIVDDFTITGANAPTDTLPPTISNVAATPAANAATISWSTDEAADSQVEYGLTANYGSSTTLDASLVISHSVIVSDLNANTTYHYRVRSKDAAGNLRVSGNFTFTTIAAGDTTIFADDFNAAALDLNKWSLGTNSGNSAAVSNNALQLASVGSQSGWVTTKQSYVASNTAVTVKIVQPNNDGALGISPTVNLASTSGFFGENNWYRFYVYRDQSTGPYFLYVQWNKSGALDGLDVTGNLVINGAVYLRLRYDAAQIYFEASFDGTNWIVAYQEPFALPGYSLNNAFYYELAAYKTSSNGVLRVDDFAITSPNASAASLAKPSSDENTSTAIPQNFALSQNYPNPFNIETRMQLDLPERGWVQAVIYNLQGQEVKRLRDENFAAGTHVLHWNGANETGTVASSGVYLLRLTFEGESGTREVETKRLMLMK